ncbi:component of IIS longevity pathway SMK-1-domain-containing protein [Irpex rosettiformis]|uniref:Component of IIS longevity pathway SMK-1-domain-containing protein n=1 Tax=Irpex rosettiformis TaxID=378272 RepID=A0ACB8UDG8_9APHY|nr:component of IIS longevity pathway SMK-1-domain-containing protein [Irpex rosettiformis]
MSSVHAAETETIVLADSARPLSHATQTPNSQSPRDSGGPNGSSGLDGRTSDANKMFESMSGALDVGRAEGSSTGPDTLDASDAALGSADDHSQWVDEDTPEYKRVKVYELIGARWVDQGTAFCSGDLQDNEAVLIARAEANPNHIILSTTIRSNDVYQRQQDTLIVWTEPDGVDYALSFQEPEGCAEVWNFIQEVQRHMSTFGLSSSPTIGPEPSPATANIMRTGHLPTPALGCILEIERAIKHICRSPAMKERVCEYIQTEDYLKAIVDVFKQAEDLELIQDLHALNTCMNTILMLNDHSMYEHILDDELFFGVVGMLEYDPEFPTYKANYREFLRQTSHFHQPIPIRDETIQKKVHHTYRLQFLKDVVLARAIDDSTFNVLNSCILFNQIDIINYVQNDPAFLREAVGIFLNEEMFVQLEGLRTEGAKHLKGGDTMEVDTLGSNDTGPSANVPGKQPAAKERELQLRRDVVLLIQQLCVMGKNVQLPARMALFRALSDRGILFAVQWALGQPEGNEQGLHMICTGGEILTALLDHDLNGVRGHILKQIGQPGEDKNSRKPDTDTLVSLMCRVLTRSRDMGVQSQVGESLRVLMEIPQGEAADAHPVIGAKFFMRAKDDPGVERFLEYFYKTCVDVLFRPFHDVPEFKSLTDPVLHFSRERTNLYLHLCELLANFAAQHSFRSHFYMLSSNIASRMGSLLRAKDKHLRLAAFRFFRVTLRLNNRNLFTHLIKLDALKPVIDLTVQESRRDNLLSSACQEFFESMRKENPRELIAYCMTKHEDKIRLLSETPLSGVQFKQFIRRHEMNIEPPPKEEEKVDKSPNVSLRRWGQGRLLEAEEESYFNTDDDEDDAPVNLSNFPKLNNPSLKRKRALSVPMRSQIQRPPMPVVIPSLGSLVDYDDGEDLGGFEAAEDPPLAIPHDTSQRIQGSPGPEVPATPKLINRPITSNNPSSTLPPLGTEDPEDSLLESLLSKSDSSRPPELGLGAKRPRDDEDDELLAIATKAKRQSMGTAGGVPGKDAGNGGPVVVKLGGMKTSEDGPKKIKLKLSSPSSTTPSPSSTGVKDGDTG